MYERDKGVEERKQMDYFKVKERAEGKGNGMIESTRDVKAMWEKGTGRT
jgi:hypothetical protein